MAMRRPAVEGAAVMAVSPPPLWGDLPPQPPVVSPQCQARQTEVAAHWICLGSGATRGGGSSTGGRSGRQCGVPRLATPSGARDSWPTPSVETAGATPAAEAEAEPSSTYQSLSGGHAGRYHHSQPEQQPRCQQQGERGSCEADSCATLRHRTLSFVRCVGASHVLQSALLSLELGGSHPPAEGAEAEPAGGLHSTLAQLLALHLRTGNAEATGSSLLAALWLLEASHSSSRSPASVCLASWLKYLAGIAPQLVPRLVTNWGASFRLMQKELVAAQAGMLERLSWRVRLDWHADVQPCLRLLFPPEVRAERMPAPPAALHHATQTPDAAAAMRTLCAGIEQVAVRIKRNEAWEAAAGKHPGCEHALLDGQMPAKRRCTAG